jgi:hypothetical protein
MQRILEIIRRDVAEEKVKIDTPTQNLESYFLDVVQKARQSAAETSGATSGNRVAAYLRGDAEESSAAARVLDRLTQPAQPKPAEQVTSEPEVDQAKLEALTRPTEDRSEDCAPAESPDPKKEADLARANEKLSSLLGKPK